MKRAEESRAFELGFSKGRRTALQEVQALAPHEVGCRCEHEGEFDWHVHDERCARRQIGEMLAVLRRDERGLPKGPKPKEKDVAEPKRIDIKEFRELGFLQEANRLFFHLVGLALETVVEDCPYCVKGESDGGGVCGDCHGTMKYERLGGIWDYRDDPEGMTFGEGYGLDPGKAAYVDAERGNHAAHRFELFGLDELPTFHWAVQPLSGNPDIDQDPTDVGKSRREEKS